LNALSIGLFGCIGSSCCEACAIAFHSQNSVLPNGLTIIPASAHVTIDESRHSIHQSPVRVEKALNIPPARNFLIQDHASFLYNRVTG
jgi:hypothetical protein